MSNIEKKAVHFRKEIQQQIQLLLVFALLCASPILVHFMGPARFLPKEWFFACIAGTVISLFLAYSTSMLKKSFSNLFFSEVENEIREDTKK